MKVDFVGQTTAAAAGGRLAGWLGARKRIFASPVIAVVKEIINNRQTVECI